MKMNETTFAVLRDVILAQLKKHDLTISSAIQHYRDAGQTDKRCRWDMFHSTGLNLHRLQPGLWDSHIDTALRKITGTN